jgi:fructan beta-fructosidase
MKYPLWVDYGMDDYAGVTWSNTPGSRVIFLGSRVIFLGWMSNWLYAGNVPTTIWRGSSTLPRELSLVDNGGTPLLASLPVKELASVGSSFKEIGSDASLGYDKPYQLQITLNALKTSTIRLSNTSGQYVDIEVSSLQRLP